MAVDDDAATTPHLPVDEPGGDRAVVGHHDRMRLVLTVVDPVGTSTPAAVEVCAAPGTPLSELRDRLLGAVGRTDGRLFAGTHQLPDDATLGVPPLLDGAVLTVDRTDAREPHGLLELHVVAGPDSGAVHRLAPGEHGLGRAAEATVRVDDPDVSRLHAVLRVGAGGCGGTTVHDLGSTNGSSVDGERLSREGRQLRPGELLRVGDTRMALVVPQLVPVSCHPDGNGHLEVNRPPRHRAPTTPLRATRPTEPAQRERTRFPLVAILLPLVAGVALVAITRSPTYLLFVLLSPLMALGAFVAERSGGHRSARAMREAYVEECARVDSVVARAVADELAARHRTHPGPAELMLTATGPRPRLWERRRTDDDALELRLGLGTVASQVELRDPSAPGGLDRVEHPEMTEAPVTVSLVEAGVLGLAGGRSRRLPLARSLVAQVAGWHSPRWTSMVVLTAEPSRDWEWVRWLPHLRPDESGPLLVGVEPAQVRARVDELVALLESRRATSATGVDRHWTGPTTVVVLDGAGALRRQPGVARLLDEGPAVGLRFLCLDRDVVSLPVECGATVEVAGVVGTRLRVVAAATTYDDVVADGVSDRWAVRFGRALAPLRDATPDDTDHGLPDSVRLLDLLPFDATDPVALETAWRVSGRDSRVVLGVGPDGEPFVIDLAHDGPHALVAGTTGSGKSELLQTMVAGLAVANRPDEMSFVLVDYKGGAAFQECALLPHTVGIVTDLDGRLTERALQSLGAELRRRETVLNAAGCKDLDDYLRESASGGPPMPRLVLVVDEFATLAEELPDFVGGLVGIAQRGRSLGVHLVLATQRPGGVVSPDIRANTSLRIALRVTDPAESSDVVDVRDAAGISRAHPGRAVVRVGAGAVRSLQSARVGGHETGSTPVRVRVVPWERTGDPGADVAVDAVTGPTDLARLVVASRAAAARLGAEPVASPWLPPLPDVVTVDQLSDLADVTGRAVGAGRVALGVMDLPDEQRRAALTFDLDGGDHLLVTGSARSGRSTVLLTLAAGLAGRHDACDVHLFGLDGGGGALAPLTALPHTGAVVGRDETERGDRLLARLAGELERRQRLLSGCGFGSHEEQRRSVPPADRLPWLVLLADGWEGLVTAYDAIDHGRPVEVLLRLVREGAGAGIRVVLSGDRSALTGRAGSAFRDRLVLRFADPADYGLAGISPRLVPAAMPAGRALVGPEAREVQLAVLDPGASGAGQVRAVEAAGAAARSVPGRQPHPGRLPMRVEALPERVEVAEVEAAAKASEPGPCWALVGVGGDELAPLGVDLDLDGPAFVVAGPTGSGRSTALLTMGGWLLARGREIVVIAHRRSPLRALGDEPGALAVLGASEALELDRLLLERPDLVVLADDAETLHDTPVERPLLGTLRADAPGRAALVLAGSAADLAGQFRGLTVEARRGRTGLLLGALGPVDGDLLGVRTPRTEGRVPGRGLLVVRGHVTPVQVAHSPL